MSYTTVQEWTSAIADAIRKKEGSYELIAHQDFPDRIAAIKCGITWGDICAKNYEGDIVIEAPDGYTETLSVPPSLFQNANITSLTCLDPIKFGDYSFKNSAIVSVNCPEATAANLYAFQACSHLTSVYMPKLAEVYQYSFASCGALQEIELDALSGLPAYVFQACSSLVKAEFKNLYGMVENYAFQNCGNLEHLDVGLSMRIYDRAFANSTKLHTLIIRKPYDTTELMGTNSIANTAIASGTGYIYVPSARVEDYKAATNWSTYATQFRALEDYTVDGTTAGDLDPTKI